MQKKKERIRQIVQIRQIKQNILIWKKPHLKNFITKDYFYINVETFFDLYTRSFGSSYAKSFFWVMWGIMQRLVAYTMFVVAQS